MLFLLLVLVLFVFPFFIFFSLGAIEKGGVNVTDNPSKWPTWPTSFASPRRHSRTRCMHLIDRGLLNKASDVTRVCCATRHLIGLGPLGARLQSWAP